MNTFKIKNSEEQPWLLLFLSTYFSKPALVLVMLVLVSFSSLLKAQQTHKGKGISWLPGNNTISLPAASEINSFISQLNGKMRVMVCQYNGSINLCRILNSLVVS